MKRFVRMGVLGLFSLALIGLVAALIIRHRVSLASQVVRAQTAASSGISPSTRAAAPAQSAAQVTNSPDHERLPFPVSHQSSNFEWAAADGKDTNVIRQLAHNDQEYRRMLIENSTIFRRQLVYFTQGLVRLAQQASQTGQSLKEITLPGLDGQEFDVDVTRTDLRNDGNKGQIYGQLPGRPDSMVTAAFVGLREAFTIISPQDQVYLQAEAREPNEVVVKSINPNTYGTFGSGK